MKKSVNKETEKQKYYTLEKINSKNCEYNLIIGERSNGKTFACLKQALDLYLSKGIATAYIRRWSVDLIGKRSAQLFSSVLENYDLVAKTNNKYNEIYCVSNKWYLSYYDKEKRKIL